MEEEAKGEPLSGSGGGTVNRGPESRSAAFVSDFEAAARALRGSDESLLPSSTFLWTVCRSGRRAARLFFSS